MLSKCVGGERLLLSVFLNYAHGVETIFQRGMWPEAGLRPAHPGPQCETCFGFSPAACLQTGYWPPWSSVTSFVKLECHTSREGGTVELTLKRGGAGSGKPPCSPFFACQDFPGGSDDKESDCSAGDPGSIPGQGDPLGKGMATQSSILVWRIPWTEESGRLQSMGLQRVRHD